MYFCFGGTPLTRLNLADKELEVPFFTLPPLCIIRLEDIDDIGLKRNQKLTQMKIRTCKVNFLSLAHLIPVVLCLVFSIFSMVWRLSKAESC